MISVGGVVEQGGTVVTASAPTTLTVSNNPGLVVTGPGAGSLDVRIAGIAGFGQKADGGTRVAPARQVGRIRVVEVENKDEGFRRLRIRAAD